MGGVYTETTIKFGFLVDLEWFQYKPSVCSAIRQVYPAQNMLRSAASQENQNIRLNIEFLICLAKTFGLVAIFWFQYINICAGASPA